MRPLSCLVSQMKTKDRCPQAKSASHFNLHSILLIVQLLRRLQVSKLPSFNLPCKANHFYGFQSFICFKFQVISSIFVFIPGYIFQRVLQCPDVFSSPATSNRQRQYSNFKSMNYFYCTSDCLSNHARICQVTSHFVAHQRGRITCPIYDGRYSVQCENIEHKVKSTRWTKIFALNVKGRQQPLRLMR